MRWTRDNQDPHYVSGDYNRICERTGFKVKASQTLKEWTGRIVRKESFELRQPQDLIRVRPERQMVHDPRSEPDDNFLATNEVVASDL